MPLRYCLPPVDFILYTILFSLYILVLVPFGSLFPCLFFFFFFCYSCFTCTFNYYHLPSYTFSFLDCTHTFADRTPDCTLYLLLLLHGYSFNIVLFHFIILRL